ncbi:MAG: cryptochrome/photolyase family protein [Paracoccaceae bacterium]
MSVKPILLWFRRDLRLSDHPMLAAAARTGRPVIPVFLCDEAAEALGAAPKWRMGEAVGTFGRALAALGSRLILRRGAALSALRALVEETGAGAVWWSRGYDPAFRARDGAVKSGLTADGVEARSFAGFLLAEPWAVKTAAGGYYRVYTPFWQAVRDRDPGVPLPPPDALRAPDAWPPGERLEEWAPGAAMWRGAGVVAAHARIGEVAAAGRLLRFLAGPVGDYRERRDIPAEDATSRLSEHLTWGEISPRQVWAAGQGLLSAGARGAEQFLKELVWREFAWHLLYHFPRLATANWREGWEAFPWRADNTDAERWRRGMTGEPFVDAAMREMYVTGTMHNRARMIAASYLSKHLLTDWRVGQAWFADCLTDWDPAANALGWQWVAGSGPDAAPYFRIFNPAGQAAKFDADGIYRDRWIAEGRRAPQADALSFFAAVPKSWVLSPDQPYPAPLIALDKGRERALAAFSRLEVEPR